MAPAMPVMRERPLASGIEMRTRSRWISLFRISVTVEKLKVALRASLAPLVPRIEALTATM
jgi:hypothetical protein